jgi:transcription termination/antitermination protein NusG
MSTQQFTFDFPGKVSVGDVLTGECVREWFAVYTQPRHEKTAAKQLESRSIESFLPLYQVTRSYQGRRAKVELPLFPGYLFTRISRAERTNVLTAPGVLRLVSVVGKPVAIPDVEIEALRHLLICHKAEPTAYMGLGKRVRFVGGPFSGLEGTVARTKGVARVIVSMDLIMRSVAVEVDAGQLELLREHSHSPVKLTTFPAA